MPRVVHFEVCADNENMERAAKFYTKIFGWEVDKWEGNNGSVYWPVNTGDEPEQGINGGLVQRHDPAHVTRIVLGMFLRWTSSRPKSPLRAGRSLSPSSLSQGLAMPPTLPTRKATRSESLRTTTQRLSRRPWMCRPN